MGLPMSAGSLPIGMSVGFQNMAPMLSGFQQMWATAAAGQQYPGGLVNAAQLQELYGGMNGIEAPPPAHTQQPSVSSDVQASALYRFVVFLLSSYSFKSFICAVAALDVFCTNTVAELWILSYTLVIHLVHLSLYALLHCILVCLQVIQAIFFPVGCLALLIVENGYVWFTSIPRRNCFYQTTLIRYVLYCRAL